MTSNIDGPVVIAGAGLAGLRVAESLRRLGYDGTLTLVGAETRMPYDRPALSKSLLVQDEDPAEPVPLRRDPYDTLRLDLRLGNRAESLDIDARRIHLADGAELSYGRLVVATGLRPRELPALSGYRNVLSLRTWDDCVTLRRALRVARRITVIGGGVLGCEIAASARVRNIEVDLVEGLTQPMAGVLGSRVGEALARLHRSRGVRVHCGTVVGRVTGSDRVTSLVLTDSTALATDLVVVAVGATPNTDWLVDSGLDITDGVRVDRFGSAGPDGVFAAGDVARVPHGPGNIRIEHWTNANDTAPNIAANVLGARTHVISTVPYFWSDQHEVKLQCLGVPGPDDDVTVVAGSFAEGRFLALYSSGGRVRGAVGLGMAGALARCRASVGARSPLAEVLHETPWTRRSPVPTGGSR